MEGDPKAEGVFLYKVTFVFLGHAKVLCCKKLEYSPLLFMTLSEIVKNPEVFDHQYRILMQKVCSDSYEEFKDRKLIKIPLNSVLLVEELETRKLKAVREIDD